MTEPAVAARGVTRRFGGLVALRGVDLEVAEGERLALFGPNGSGKTTLLKLLAGLIPPSRGRIEIGGATYERDGQSVRRRIGVLGHHPYLYDDLSGEENLLFYGRMYGVDGLGGRVTEGLALATLTARRRDKVRTYSRGMQQRLALARATLHDPDILLFDEPDTGLDQEAFAGIRRFFDHPDGSPRAVVMATHDLALGHACCERLAFLAEGRIVQQAKAAGLDLPGLERLYWQCTARRAA